MSVRVYVGNLPKDIEREQLEAVFAEHSEEIVSVKLVTDRKTGKCRGFGFVTVKTDEQADALVSKFSDFTLQENTLKIEKALPRSKKEDGDADSGRRKSSAKGRSKPATSSAEAAQPDPRWAGELEKLKEMLAAQTTGS
ncbi:RNA recognition motif domain-containing protein [Leptolyngbya iicbica]|uniref:RNA-binding protein n=2 Tax=Cyanophyceae TaxID=3028117 RepID=A0A4Q7E297_9CYAN|nr:RNA-binding protein [Leptolyngbya sp. LK]RZM76540.1 RNA-binding protein [Leptolyngbya sp. LK]